LISDIADVWSFGRVEGEVEGMSGGRKPWEGLRDEEAWEEGRVDKSGGEDGGTRGAVVCSARAVSLGASTEISIDQDGLDLVIDLQLESDIDGRPGMLVECMYMYASYSMLVTG
jgi:hypothetical protein